MSSSPNPKAIGAFVTGALAVFIGMILFFGSSSVFTKESRYILFFDQSVNGLTVGSPVKFRGVPVGSVEQVLIRVEGQAEDSNAIPVIVGINHDLIQRDLSDTSTVFEPGHVESYVKQGLVGQLSVESYITGQIFVEFSFRPDMEDRIVNHMKSEDGLVEIPTIGTSFDQITDDVSALIENFSSINLQELSDSLNRVLSNVADVLEGVDGKQLSRSLSEAIDEFTLLLRSDDLKSTIVAARTSLNELERTARIVGETAETYDLTDGPMAARLDLLTRDLIDNFSNVDVFFREATALLEPDSSVRYEFESTMRELGRTAKAIRTLADYLERNPNALITGRPDGSNK